MRDKRFIDIEDELEKIKNKSIEDQKIVLKNLVENASIGSFDRFFRRRFHAVLHEHNVDLDDAPMSLVEQKGELCVVIVYIGPSQHKQNILNDMVDFVQSTPIKHVVVEVVLNGESIFVE